MGFEGPWFSESKLGGWLGLEATLASQRRWEAVDSPRSESRAERGPGPAL